MPVLEGFVSNIALRKKAYALFKKKGLPTTKDENWKYTHLHQLNELALVEAFVPSPEYLLKNQSIQSYLNQLTLTPWRAVFVDGYFSQELSRVPSVSGLEILTLKEAAKKYKKVINDFFSKTEKEKSFVQLNKALAFEGLFIKAESSFNGLEEPVVCVYLTTQKNVAVNIRNIILLDQNARLGIVEVYKGLETGYFNNAVTQVELKKDSKLNYIKSQEENLRGYHIHYLEADLANNAELTSDLFSLGAHLCRNEIEVKLSSPYSQCKLHGLFAATEKQHVDNNTFIDHVSGFAQSGQHYKGILDGESHGVFSGKVRVEKNAQKTDAQQKNQNLLLSAKARVDTKPSLLIYADDVKCSHGATIGDLDKQAVFYLRSRGIEESTAKQILTKAFANEMIEKITHEKSKAYFDKLLSAWFHQQVLH